jgi:pilus assembly protein CpaB
VRTNNIVVLMLALVMGGIAAFLAYNWLQARALASNGAQPVGTIVVAAKPLPFGVAVTPDSVTEIPWAAKVLPEGAFVTKDELLSNGRRVVLAALAANEPILRSKVTGPGQRASLSSLLQEGKRAVTVRVDDVRGVAGFILPGDFVDVVLIKTEEEHLRRENYSEILLQRIKVLAIDQLASERQEQPTIAKAVTLEVTPEQSQMILLATNVGKLSLVLRQPDEAGAAATRRITEQDLTEAKAPAPPPALAIVAPPPPPVVQSAPVPNTVNLAIVHGMKREMHTVTREGTRDSATRPVDDVVSAHSR